MYCSAHLRALVLSVAILLPGATPALAQNPQLQNDSQRESTSTVHLRWGARPGVSRYRLQLSRDREFGDIVFDRVVTGNDYQINDLQPGDYFWRIAALTTTLGEFSTAAPIEVRERAVKASEGGSQSSLPLKHALSTESAGASTTAKLPAGSMPGRGGWRAAVGDIAHPVPAHLRARDRLDLVGINTDGVVFALDSATGIALWSTGRGTQRAHPTRVAPPLLLRSRSGTDNVAVLSGTNVSAFEGASGRELWRSTLPVTATSGAVLSDSRTSEIFVLDNSLQRIFILDANNGNTLAQVRLPNRLIGAPVAMLAQGVARVMLAYDSGQVEIRDASGGVVRSGDAGSAATTPPLYINGRRGDLILVGTRSGLTALTADELRPLGSFAMKDDAPRGILTAQDLDADGFPEVIMMTDRGRVAAVNATDGKPLWEAMMGDAIEGNEPGTVAFADVNGDQVLDVVMAGGQTFAFALSGRDGSVVWKDSEPPTSVANHAASIAPRAVIAVPYGSGALLIGGDASRIGLRAIEFPRGIAGPNR
jgi:outer membrane protein assembly factor BamB